MKKEDAALPTVFLDSIFISGVIEAIESWYLAIIDLLEKFYMQTLGKLKTSIKEYINKIIDEFPEVIERPTSTPVAEYLFQIRDETEASNSDGEMAISFHHAATQILFLSG